MKKWMYAAALLVILAVIVLLLARCGKVMPVDFMAGKLPGRAATPGQELPGMLRQAKGAAAGAPAAHGEPRLKAGYVVMASYDGSVQWSITLPGSRDISAEHAERLRNGTTAVLCRAYGSDGEPDSFFTAVLDDSGRVKSVTEIGPDVTEEGRAVFETREGQAVFGTAREHGKAGYSVFMTKTGSSGDYRQVKTFSSDSLEWPEESVETRDGYYMSLGQEENTQQASQGVVITRRDRAGEYLWSRKYARGDMDRVYSITDAGNGNYLLAGMTGDSAGMRTAAAAVIIDADGSTVMVKEWQGKGYDAAFAAAPAANGYALAGASSEGKNGGYDMLLIVADYGGNSVMTAHYGGPGNDAAFAVVDTGKGYLLAGMTEVRQ